MDALPTLSFRIPPTALALDKTGTITEGKPKVVEIQRVTDATEEEILRVAAAIAADLSFEEGSCPRRYRSHLNPKPK